MYVKVAGNTVQKYPYSFNELKRDNPQVSFPQTPTQQILELFGVFEVVDGTKPTFNPETEQLSRSDNPVKTGSDWVLGWNVIPLDADTKFQKKRSSGIPANYDNLDIEALGILRDEVQHFDNGSQVTTPGCALVATALGVNEDNIRNAVRNKGNAYRTAIITAWAERRVAKGGA